MNSVLEPEREILLSENLGQEGAETERIVATKGFQFVGTMNPGGDFGKKELSPALKNRFTEVWCPTVTSPEDLATIVRKNLAAEFLMLSMEMKMIEFMMWFKENLGKPYTLSVRDLLAWVDFVNNSKQSCKNVSIGISS